MNLYNSNRTETIDISSISNSIVISKLESSIKEWESSINELNNEYENVYFYFILLNRKKRLEMIVRIKKMN